jgi:hypothetical protein
MSAHQHQLAMFLIAANLVACASGQPLDVQPFRTQTSEATVGVAQPSPAAQGDVGRPNELAEPVTVSSEEPEPAREEPSLSAPERKVDFVFVIDSREAMADEQARLAATTPALAALLGDELGARDLRVLVVDTGSEEALELLGRDEVATCDTTLGAGRRLAGDDLDCGIAGDAHFVSSAQSDFGDVLECLVGVGTSGDDDGRVIDALLAAISPVLTDSGCNAGFLRDDAALVVTLLSDDDDRDSEGDPEQWRVALSAIRPASEVVMIGLLGDSNVDGGLAGGPCSERDADDAPRLQRFIESFELGVLGSVCAPSYLSLFQDALPAIDTALEAVALGRGGD